MMLEMSDEPPDDILAKPIIEKYYNRKLVIEENGKKTYVPFKMGDSIELFQTFGEGTYFYFYFLKYFSIVFGILSLASIFPIYLMITENTKNFKGDINPFYKTMLANMPELRTSESDDENSQTSFVNQEHIDMRFTLFYKMD